jgi:hypothetical protein
MGIRSGVETARLLFPYSCLTDLSKHFNNVGTVAEQPDGLLRVDVFETEPAQGDVTIYLLSPALVAQKVELSDMYRMHHRQLEGRGSLSHTLDQDGETLRKLRLLRPDPN